ncbi:MAG: adenylate/guanylate cyclase domain-containing protein [Actinomycetota bacterium]
MVLMPGGQITVLLADDNLIVREGVRALLSMEPDFEVVAVAADYDELIARAEEFVPQVLVTDIRMPPNFQSEGIDAAKQVRKRNPGTGVVILSQYDDPEYAISLLAEGQDGYAYLLKDRVGEGDQLAHAIRAVATGGSALDPKIIEALVRPVSSEGDLTPAEEEILRFVAEGRPHKRIAATLGMTPAAVAADVEKLFLKIAQGASAGTAGALRRLQTLHKAIVDREEVGETLEHMLPEGIAEKLRQMGKHVGESERMVVTVLMSDVRGYSGIAERTDPTHLAGQLNAHRGLLIDAIQTHGGTHMQFTGDGVMAVFGAPFPQEDHADRALRAAIQMHESQGALNATWIAQGLAPFNIGIGLSTGEVAAALLGSEDRMEYTLVGDTVNLSARLQDLARPGGQIVLSEATFKALEGPVDAELMDPTLVKGRAAEVVAYRIQVVDFVPAAEAGAGLEGERV